MPGAVTSIFRRPWHLICVLWFVMHIPTTILVDGQSIIPAKHYPKPLRDLLQWHIATNGDFLVRDNPLWFASLVWCELLVQLPFFFAATYAYVAGKNWIRAPAIMYGAHAATTLVPILAELAFSDLGRANPKRYEILAIYSIYLAMPLAIALTMAGSRIPFPSERKKKVA